MGLSVPTPPLEGGRLWGGHRVVLGGQVTWLRKGWVCASQELDWTALGLERVSKKGLCLPTLGPRCPERASIWPKPYRSQWQSLQSSLLSLPRRYSETTM